MGQQQQQQLPNSNIEAATATSQQQLQHQGSNKLALQTAHSIHHRLKLPKDAGG